MFRTRMILLTLLVGLLAASMATPALAGGEPKNQPPFTGPVPNPPTIVLTTNDGDGFSWVDAAIGAAAGVGATCTAGALAAIARSTRRTAAAS